VSGRRAVFLDRDGTLIVDRHYLSDPAGVELLPGSARAVRRLNQAGYAAILVTNQSGIGRGLFSEADYRATHERLTALLAAEDAYLDAAYFCPLAPDDADPEALRKPGAGLFLRAARDLGVDLPASWFVGDRLRDVLPGRALGGRAIMVRGASSEVPTDWPELQIVDSLANAVDAILGPSKAPSE
jgi:D-glycero-D-manno-heptose 1,7-bisphosphate phosphatase